MAALMRVGWCLLASALVQLGVAYADDPRSPAEQARTRGETHAKRGEYAAAIDAFKEADRLEPRAKYDCMIGLTYMRRNAWAQAELFLDRCKLRALGGEVLPRWVDDAQAQLQSGLAAAPLSTIEITVKPATAAPVVQLSGFAPDETFDPHALHLPAGTYTLTVTAAGYPSVTREITSTGAHDTVAVVIDLEPTPPEPMSPTPTAPMTSSEVTPTPPAIEPPRTAAPRDRWSLPVILAGGALAVGGGAMHLIAYRKLDDVNHATGDADFKQLAKTFDREVIATYTIYGAAAVALVVGVYLRTRSREPSVDVSAVPLDGGGGLVTLGWQQ